MNSPKFKAFVLLFILLISSKSYATLKADYTKWPSSERFETSAEASYKMKQFQIPFYLGLASIILLDGNLSESIGNETYLFGSNANAARISDGLLLSLIPMMLYTSSQTKFSLGPKQSSFGQRAKLMGFEGLLVLTDFLLVTAIKYSFQRARPDESDNLSFPSGHSSVSAGLSRMVFNNIENSDLAGTTLGYTFQYSAITISALAAYARVEAKKHHLSDVLIGSALGAFISDFLYNSFLERQVEIIPVFSMEPDSQSLNLTYYF